MGQEAILSRGARILGALACAVLAGIVLAWIIRDIDKADSLSQLWWSWVSRNRLSNAAVATSYFDPLLFLVYVGAGVAALRSASAPGALGAAALLTVVLRLPGLWNLSSDWMRILPDGLRQRATLTVWTDVLLGVALLVVVAVARRPLPDGDNAHGPDATDDRLPTRPGRGASVTALVVLAAVAIVATSWEIYHATDYGWDLYQKMITGERTLFVPLGVPFAWFGWALAALTLLAACAAGTRARFARPLGVTMGAVLIAVGGGDIALYIKVDVLQHLDDLPDEGLLTVLTSFFEVLTGLIVVLVLARPGVRSDGWTGSPYARYGGYGAGGYGYGYGGYGSPSGNPPGYGPQGYGAPGTSSPGYGPQGGGTVPPPPSSPPPGW